MTFYDKISDLPLYIEGGHFELHEQETSSDFLRKTTRITLTGNGISGAGEDVTYEAEEHDALRQAAPAFPLAGDYTIASFSEHLSTLDLFFGRTIDRSEFRDFRRWGFESAALALALNQAETNLSRVLDRPYNPVRFVVSTRLGDPPAIQRIVDLLRANPDLEFKLDPVSGWTDELIQDLASTGAVRILDFKGLYEGTEVDQPPDPDLYAKVMGAFPEAVIEDAAPTEEILPLLRSEQHRLSWDYPIRGVRNIKERPFPPRWLNIKPSRFGTLQSLLDTIEYCLAQDITMYGGGQFELDVGRRHIQGLASLFYPDGPNDVAPGEYNTPTISPDPPRSPLRPVDDIRGLDWRYQKNRQSNH